MKAFPFGTNGLDLVNTSCAVLQGDQTLILCCSPKETRLLSCAVLQRRPDFVIRNDRIALLQVEVASGAWSSIRKYFASRSPFGRVD